MPGSEVKGLGKPLGHPQRVSRAANAGEHPLGVVTRGEWEPVGDQPLVHGAALAWNNIDFGCIPAVDFYVISSLSVQSLRTDATLRQIAPILPYGGEEVDMPFRSRLGFGSGPFEALGETADRRYIPVNGDLRTGSENLERQHVRHHWLSPNVPVQRRRAAACALALYPSPSAATGCYANAMSFEVLPEKLDSLNLAISNNSVIEMGRPICFLQSCDVGRSEAPIAIWPSRYDVQMKVRNLLPAAEPIVLIQEHPVGRVRGNHSSRDTLRSSHHSGFLTFRQIEKRRGVPLGQNHALSDFKLTAIQNRYGQGSAFNDVPARRRLDDATQIARIHLRQRKGHAVSPGATGRTAVIA